MKRFVMFIFLLLLSLFVQAQESLQILQNEETRLELKIESLIKKIDEKAVVYLNIVPNKNITELPMTPFLYSNLNIGSNDSLNFAKLEIIIISELTKLPEPVQLTIQNIASEYSAVAEFKYFTVANNKTDFLNRYTNQIILLFITLLLGSILLYGHKKLHHEALRLREVIESQGKALSESIENQSYGNQSGQVNDSNQELKVEVDTNSSKVWDSLPYKSYEALLTDCYWCQADEYANYVWKRATVEVKRKILESHSFFKNYVNYFSKKREKNLNLEQELYYMAPLPIAEISNQQLSELVRSKPELIKELPEIRLSALNLSAVEWINIQSNEVKALSLERIIWPQLNTTHLRNLQVYRTIEIRNDEEELKLLSQPNLSIEMKASIKSLGWIKELDSESIVNILELFTAKQLARAICGPEEITNFILENISSRKRDLILSYQEQTPADRNGVDFERLFLEIMQYLNEKEDKDQYLKAA